MMTREELEAIRVSNTHRQSMTRYEILPSEYLSAVNEVDALLAEVERLRGAVGEDTRRLDWLEQQARDAYMLTGVSEPSFGIADSDWSDCKKGESVVLTHGYADETIGATLRDAIDTAMAKEAARV